MARNTVLGMPIGKRKNSKRELAKNVAKGAALAAGPALLVPAARRAMPAAQKASRAAGQAGDLMEKGQQMKGQVSDAVDTASGIKDAVQSHSSTVGKVAGVVKAVSSKGGTQGSKPKLSHLLEQHCDVAAPRRTVYNQWTQFEMWPSIVKGIESVQQQDEDERSQWTAKIGPSRRSWTGEVVEQIPDERIAWKSQGGAQLQGVVTFHDLDEDLTRVLLQMEYKPTGAVEWVGNTLRIQRRRVKRDLRLFKHFIEVRGEETGAWRGTIDAGEKLEPAYAGQSKVQRDKRSQGSDRGSRSTKREQGQTGEGSSASGRSGNGSRSSSSRSSSSRSGSNSQSSNSRSSSSRSSSGRSGSNSQSSGSRSSGSRSSGTSRGSGSRSSGSRANSSQSSNSRSNTARSSSSGNSRSRSGSSGSRSTSSSSRSRPANSGRSSSSGGSRRSGNGSSSNRTQGGRSRQTARSGA